MEHLLLKATATATDQGVFSAVISASSVDREGDVVDPNAMVKALKAWEQTGKKIPLHWNHSGSADDVFGHIEPGSAKAINGEVHVEGWVDQSTPRGADAWRLVKSGTLGFSFGYLIPEGGATKNTHGGLNITALDVFEVTATPTPMNNDTRVTGWKSEQAAEAFRAALTAELQPIRERLARQDEEIAALKKSVDVTDKEPRARSVDPLREQAQALVLGMIHPGPGVALPDEPAVKAQPEPAATPDVLREQARALMVNSLTSGANA